MEGERGREEEREGERGRGREREREGERETERERSRNTGEGEREGQRDRKRETDGRRKGFSISGSITWWVVNTVRWALTVPQATITTVLILTGPLWFAQYWLLSV